MNVRFIDKQLFKIIRNVKTKKIEEIEFFNIKTKCDESNKKRKSYFNNNIIIEKNERYRYFQHIADKLKKNVLNVYNLNIYSIKSTLYIKINLD